MIYQATKMKSRTQWAKELKGTEYKTFTHPVGCKRGHEKLFSVSEGGKCVECVRLKDRKRYAKKLGVSVEGLENQLAVQQQERQEREAEKKFDAAVRKFQRQTERDEKEPTYQAIYALTNTYSGEVYIGSCSNPKARRSSHFSAITHGKHPVIAINEAVAEHGLEIFKFDVLCMMPAEVPRQTRYDIERLYISNWKGPMYNTRMR